MLLPSKVKFRKMHKGRGRNKRNATTKLDVSFGGYGLKAMDGARAMTRYIKRGGKIWIRIFPDKPITFHGNENTMGSGKGAVDHYVAVIRPGTVMFEMDGIPEETAREAMRLAGYKLPMRTKIVTALR